MLLDGISCHEKAKRQLELYAVNNSTPEQPVRKVKPFMLVVCKDTTHATWVKSYICSEEFREGAYRDKTIVVHSKQKGAESDFNTRLLLDVEKPDNPVEIVIHVNMLKEGWDVNNLSRLQERESRCSMSYNIVLTTAEDIVAVVDAVIAKGTEAEKEFRYY